MIRAVLFDMDGILQNAVMIHYYSLNRALENVCGFKISYEEHIRKFNGLPTKVKTSMLLAEGRIEAEQISDINDKKQKYSLTLIKETIKPDINKIRILQTFRKMGVYTACVTNSIRATTLEMLKVSGQLPYLNLVVTNEDINHPKPHPEGYLTAMKHFEIMPEEAMIVEDSPHGIASAKASGGIVCEMKEFHLVNEKNILEFFTKHTGCNVRKKYPII